MDQSREMVFFWINTRFYLIGVIGDGSPYCRNCVAEICGVWVDGQVFSFERLRWWTGLGVTLCFVDPDKLLQAWGGLLPGSAKWV